MKILIIEDEKITAEDLAHSIKLVRPNFEIVKTTSSVKGTIDFLNSFPELDLIFSDIQLSDGLSFEIFKNVESKIPVIFCTAFDEYALNAFEVNGIAYLLKPFTSETIKKAIEKFEQLTTNNGDKLSQLIQFMERKNTDIKSQSILIYQGEKIIPVKLDNIAVMYLKNGIVKIHTFDMKIFTSVKTLDELSKMHQHDTFRVNRQFLINRNAIKDAAKYFNRKLLIHLHFPFEEKIIVSKERSSTFLEWLSRG